MPKTARILQFISLCKWLTDRRATKMLQPFIQLVKTRILYCLIEHPICLFNWGYLIEIKLSCITASKTAKILSYSSEVTCQYFVVTGPIRCFQGWEVWHWVINKNLPMTGICRRVAINVFFRNKKLTLRKPSRQHGPVDRCWAGCHHIPVGKDRCGWNRTPGFVQVKLLKINK